MGTIPLVSERLKMWCIGVTINVIIFFRKEEEMPLKSGVYLDLSERVDSRISFSVSGTEVKLKECSL